MSTSILKRTSPLTTPATTGGPDDLLEVAERGLKVQEPLDGNTALTDTTDSDEIPERRNFMGRKVAPKLSQREIVQLTSQLAIMTRSGVDVASAIYSLAKQSRKIDAQEILGTIHRDVTSGATFSSSLEKYDRVFGPSYIASVTAGEASGKMWEVLDQLAKLQRSSLKLVGSLKTMIMYPIALVSVSTVVVMALVLFVLPQFAKVFAQFDAPLPWITQVLIAFSTEIRERFYIWIPLAVGVVSGTVVFLRTLAGRRVKDRLLLNIPIVGEITQFLFIGRVCRVMGLLLQSGVPLLETLELTRKGVTNYQYRAMFGDLVKNVISGNGLGTTLTDSTIVPPSAADMLMTAEATGSLGGAAELIGEYFEEEGEEKLRGLITLMEPAITIVMGVVVAIVVLAVALPMFDLSNAVQK